MQCNRLLKLAKQWYLHVKEETMAPARMVQFIKQHVASCPVCQEDPDIQDEIDRITEIILPESKIPKAVRMKQEDEESAARQKAEEEAESAEDTGEETEEEETGEFSEDNEEEPLAPENAETSPSIS